MGESNESKVRVVVLVAGRGADYEVVSPTMPEVEGLEQLRVVSHAQQRASDALLTLPWLTVAENRIRAVYLREAPSVGPRTA